MDQSSLQLQTTYESMTQPTLSIILPVFNKEAYVKRCILSILQQSYTDFELIIINDGSTDSSETEIQNAVLSDSRVKMYRYENAGVSTARNRGIAHATGKYLLFIEADSKYAKDLYHLLRALRNAGEIDDNLLWLELQMAEKIQDYSQILLLTCDIKEKLYISTKSILL